MLCVKRLTLREIRLRLREPFRISSGQMQDRRILILELEDVDGVIAWSECVAGEQPNYSPETIDTAWLAIARWLARKVLNVSFSHPALVREALDAGVCGHWMAKAALEMGCWGLASIAQGIPLTRLLGGTRNRVAAGISLGIQPSPAELVKRVVAAAKDGYRRVKVKIMPGADVEFVAAAREALGFEVSLSVDANAAYSLADLDTLQALNQFVLCMVEQPLARGDLVRHADLRYRIQTPVCLDESITSPANAEDMIRLGSADIVNIKPGRVGGYAAAREIHDLCLAAGIPVWCGGMLESGIGRAYNVALASLPNFEGDLSPSKRYWDRDVVTPEWTMDGDGYVEVPSGSGIGVEVDREFLDSITVREERIMGGN